MERARIVLLAAEGVPGVEIAARVGCSEPTVIRWRSRFDERGMAGLTDAPRNGRPPTILRTVRDEILSTTLTRPPDGLGITHWSSRLLADRLRCTGKPVSPATVARVWKRFGILPRGSGTFAFSTDPELDARVYDIVGLYFNTPDKAVVLCAVDDVRIREPDPAASEPAHPDPHDHDDCRCRTTTLFAALEVATGKVTDPCFDRYRSQEFLRFLTQVTAACPRRDLHVVSGNQSARRSPAVKAWLGKSPRVTMHLTRTPESWMNLVEVFSGSLTRQAIRHIHVTTGTDLETAIATYVDTSSARCEPFEWALGAIPKTIKTNTTSETRH